MEANRAADFKDPAQPDKEPHEWDPWPTVMLEVPGEGYIEKSVHSRIPSRVHIPVRYPLVRPKNYQAALEPIEEIITMVKLTLDFFLTSKQAFDHFRYKKRPTDPKKPFEPHAGDITFKLDDAATAADGPTFVAQIDRFNVEMRKLKAQGKIRDNIRNMAGVPEELWAKISFQVYERTVGPRVNELKKYKAFSDQVCVPVCPRLPAAHPAAGTARSYRLSCTTSSTRRT
jgi:hypothetical protein